MLVHYKLRMEDVGTICMPAPRPEPTTIWYPVHAAVLVDAVSVERSPLPMAVTAALADAQGR